MHRKFARVVLVGVVACGGQASETTPQPEEGARAASGPADGVRPCDGYVERGLRCAAEEDEADGRPRDADLLDLLEDGLREECRFWLESGATRDDLDDALRSCDTVPCADGAAAWTSCVAEGLPAAAVERVWNPSTPTEWTRVEPRPIPADVPPCETYIAWAIECLREAMGGDAFDAVVGETVREEMQSACDAFAQAGVGGLLDSALAACADVACGTTGTDLVTCIARELIRGVTGGARGEGLSP